MFIGAVIPEQLRMWPLTFIKIRLFDPVALRHQQQVICPLPNLYICSVIVGLYSGGQASLPGACPFLETVLRSLDDL